MALYINKQDLFSARPTKAVNNPKLNVGVIAGVQAGTIAKNIKSIDVQSVESIEVIDSAIAGAVVETLSAGLTLQPEPTIP
jgi:hypothetical protein